MVFGFSSLRSEYGARRLARMHGGFKSCRDRRRTGSFIRHHNAAQVLNIFFGVWRSWLARMHGVHEVASSSLATPTKLDIGSFRKKVRARFARALGGFCADFPPQSAIRPTNPNRLFWQAGGGSKLRSNSSRKCGISNFFLSARGGIQSKFLIPRFCAVGAMSKGDNY